MSLRFDLPWPDKRLSPNSRTHWRPKADVIKAARLEAHVLCVNALAGVGLGMGGHLLMRAKCGVGVKLTFRPADKRRRDVDNCIASMKAALDGIASALKADDSNFKLSAEIGEPRKPACVVVEIA